MIVALHHIQIAMPKGGEARARALYAGVLGFEEVSKPPALVGRGGAWFERDGVRVHLGVDEPFAPARKAHPAFQVASLADMVAVFGTESRVHVDLPGTRRMFVADPFGNRIELLEVVP